MVVTERIRTVLESHPKLLTVAFVASTYSAKLLELSPSNAANGGP